MSQSPLEAPPKEAGSEPDRYAAGWSALSKSLRRGFSWSGNERNSAYLNTGPGPDPSDSRPTFASFSGASGLDLNQDGRAAVALDWDHDGDLDLWLSSRSEPRLRLMRNDIEGDPSVQVQPVGTTTNRDGVGARVELLLQNAPWPALTRTRRAGEGILAQGGSWLHFGLGEGTLQGCIVHWPGGAREEFVGIEGPGRFQLVEGSGRATAPPGAGAPNPASATASSGKDADDTGAPSMPAAPELAGVGRGTARVVLSSPRPIPSLALQTKDGRNARFLGVKPEGSQGTGTPLLVLLWAQWCAPCIAELRGLQSAEAALRGAGINVLALSVDEQDDRATARSRLEQMGWSFSSGFATPEATDVLDVLAGSIVDSEERLALPSSFLIDEEGRLLAMYRGPIAAAQVLADLERIRADGPLAAATPFPGTWAIEPQEADLRGLASRFERRGLMAPARELQLSLVEVRKLSTADFQLTRGRARLARGDVAGAAQDFRGAVASDPESFEAQAELALALHRLGDARAALEAYERALAIDPSSAPTRFNMALALAQSGKLDQAQAQVAVLKAEGSPLAAELEARLLQVREMPERP